MITMGKTQVLKALRTTDNGCYLTDGEAEILLPRKEVPDHLAMGSELSVFIYRDSEDRPTATLVKPLAEAGELAYLTVRDVSDFGAFADWGLLKELLIPVSQQVVPLTVGQKVLVLVLVDHETDRIFATTKLTAHLNRSPVGWKPGQPVTCKVWKPHERGWLVLTTDLHQGMVYLNETRKALKIGENLTLYVSQVREDGKIDFRLGPQGFSQANPDHRLLILEALTNRGGKLPVGDKSTPQEIEKLLGISKKAFKTACGTLYKDQKILLEDQAIRLRESN